MQMKQVRMFTESEVQHQGLSGDHRNWMPHQGLPEMESGKEIVVIYPCDCGCWEERHEAAAMNLIRGSTNPERYVLYPYDERYIVQVFEVPGSRRYQWYIIER